MGRQGKYPLTLDLVENMEELLSRINDLERELEMKFGVSSGYRPKEINDTLKNASKNSWHTRCAAIDIQDPHQYLSKLLKSNQGLLEKHDLYMEDPGDTPTWCHLQIFPPVSKKRVFIARTRRNFK